MQDAVAADAEIIAKIGTLTFAASFAHSMPAAHMQAYLDETYTPAAITKDLANKQNCFFVAKLNPALAAGKSDVVGFIQMKLGTTEPCLPQDLSMCELHRIYVSRDHLGEGVGQLMMERGLKWARDQLSSARRLDRATGDGDDDMEERKAGIWLGVWDENVKAQRFYSRWGFERIGGHDFVIDDTTQTDLIMIKWL